MKLFVIEIMKLISKYWIFVKILCVDIIERVVEGPIVRCSEGPQVNIFWQNESELFFYFEISGIVIEICKQVTVSGLVRRVDFSDCF